MIFYVPAMTLNGFGGPLTETKFTKLRTAGLANYLQTFAQRTLAESLTLKHTITAAKLTFLYYFNKVLTMTNCCTRNNYSEA